MSGMRRRMMMMRRMRRMMMRRMRMRIRMKRIRMRRIRRIRMRKMRIAQNPSEFESKRSKNCRMNFYPNSILLFVHDPKGW
jgi:hypothetical protein